MIRLKKGISFICLISFLFVFLCPTQAFANTAANYEADQVVENVNQYLYTTENGLLKFDKERAITNCEDEIVIQTGEKIEEIALAYYEYELAQETGIALAVTIPIYGNYCGPGYGSGFPLDVLDAQCQKHDDCYGGTEAPEGYHSCYCDWELVDDVRSVLSSLDVDQTVTAYAIIGYFERKASNPVPESQASFTSCVEY